MEGRTLLSGSDVRYWLSSRAQLELTFHTEGHPWVYVWGMDQTAKSEPEQKEWVNERRKMRRLLFSASAKVMNLGTQQIFNMRMTDVGIGGCFLDTIFPFAVGSRLRVTLRSQMIQFQADGKVVYAQPRVGMGIAFDELNGDQRLAVLALV